jgi:hypothetical protein
VLRTISLTIWKADINTDIYMMKGVSRVLLYNYEYQQRIELTLSFTSMSWLMTKVINETLIQDTLCVRENVRLYDLSWFCHQEVECFLGNYLGLYG